jgi:hypothetical protein
MPYFYQEVEVNIDIDEIVDSCSLKEKQLLLDVLRSDVELKANSILVPDTNSDWDILVSKLMGMGQHRLTNEEEALIRNITEKLL